MNKHSHLTLSESAHAQIFPSLTSYNEVNHYLAQNPDTWSVFLDLPYKIQQELLDFYTGKQGLRVTYDSIFQKLFRPDIHKKRLESLLSHLDCNEIEREALEKEFENYDLTPLGIIEKLNLIDRDYESLAEGCHYREALI